MVVRVVRMWVEGRVMGASCAWEWVGLVVVRVGGEGEEVK